MSKKATNQFAFSIVWKNLAQTGIALAFLLLVWGIAYVVEGNELLVPSVSDCLNRMVKLLTDGSFWRACFQTLNRVFLAFGISFIFAVIFLTSSMLVSTHFKSSTLSIFIFKPQNKQYIS